MPLQGYGAKDVTGMQSNIASTFQTFVPVVPAPVVKWKQFLHDSSDQHFSVQQETWMAVDSFWMNYHSEWIWTRIISKHGRTRIMTRRVVSATSLRPTALSPGKRQDSVWICMNHDWALSSPIANQGFLAIYSPISLPIQLVLQRAPLKHIRNISCVALDTLSSMFCFQLWAPNVGPETWDIMKQYETYMLKRSRFAWVCWGVLNPFGLRWYGTTMNNCKNHTPSLEPCKLRPSFPRPPPAPDCPSHPWSHTETTNCSRPTLP